MGPLCAWLPHRLVLSAVGLLLPSASQGAGSGLNGAPVPPACDRDNLLSLCTPRPGRCGSNQVARKMPRPEPGPQGTFGAAPALPHQATVLTGTPPEGTCASLLSLLGPGLVQRVQPQVWIMGAYGVRSPRCLLCPSSASTVSLEASWGSVRLPVCPAARGRPSAGGCAWIFGQGEC